jgi:hypothetical protein
LRTARAATVLALGLALTGCGSGVDTQDPAGSSAIAGKTAAGAWADARGQLIAAGSGRYSARVLASGLAKPITSETGSFDLVPGSSSSERTFAGVDEKTSQARQFVVRLRQTAGDGNFLQVADWGSWDGCWLPMTAADLERQTGVEVEGAPRLPPGLRVLLGAKVGPKIASTTGDGPVAEAGAVEVLQFLGVSAAALSGVAEDLRTVKAPVLLGIGADGRPAGVTANGVEVLHALAAAEVPLSTGLSGYISKAQAELAISELGTPVAVVAPSARLRLPANAAPKQTCPANR